MKERREKTRFLYKTNLIVVDQRWLNLTNQKLLPYKQKLMFIPVFYIVLVDLSTFLQLFIFNNSSIKHSLPGPNFIIL